ncbi:hypothetical protein DDZ18_01050 [Marinicauda salina]|uniref:Uncharacterized protein n=1 Tax=Marinicauda salina TaxID=2135793 RepID=A0A2U2BW56_9PROT|nr:hypothetical protein [Marinicauda salina]PWE18227.1 hypothetical protein DDZ18_01050 [Marinicauda salina]
MWPTAAASLLALAQAEAADPAQGIDRIAERRAEAILAGPIWESLAACPGAPDPLARALVAVESDARPGWVRGLELGWARAVMRTTGDAPDLTLGPAQIRVSKARALRPDLDDDALLAALSEPCAALDLAEDLLDAENAGDEESAIRAWRGLEDQHPSRDRPGDRLYAAIALRLAAAASQE